MAMMERLFKFACQEAQEKEGGGETGGEWKGDTGHFFLGNFYTLKTEYLQAFCAGPCVITNSPYPVRSNQFSVLVIQTETQVHLFLCTGFENKYDVCSCAVLLGQKGENIHKSGWGLTPPY